MAKTYVNTVKYQIKLDFEIDGIVDKPDIIGAIFGQSEGLLGDEMDLKELQKNGKLGRIEINHKTSMGRTKGNVVVPSSMDMAETSLLAAGIESVDKVGPCEASFKIIDIEDTRTDKRQEIKSRAQELLKRMMEKSRPDTHTLSEELKENVRAADIVLHGPDKLPAGPEAATSRELIVVEGRADVLNLLRNQIKNVVGMNGSNISQGLIDLCKNKEVTAFVDGDRGGILNARKLSQLVNVEFIAKAPDGKEVEELTRKEILLSLKKKMPADASERQRSYPKFDRPRRIPGPRRGPRNGPRGNWDRNSERRERPPIPFPREERPVPYPAEERPPVRKAIEREILNAEEKETFKPVLEELKGSMKARLLDDKNKKLKEIKVKDMVDEIAKSKKQINAIIFDGVITKRLVDAAEKAGAKYVIGARKGKIEESKTVKAAAL